MHVASHVGRYMRMSALVENLANPIQPDCSGISIPREQFLDGLPQHVVTRHRAPGSAVGAVTPIVAHHEEMPVGHNLRIKRLRRGLNPFRFIETDSRMVKKLMRPPGSRT